MPADFDPDDDTPFDDAASSSGRAGTPLASSSTSFQKKCLSPPHLPETELRAFYGEGFETKPDRPLPGRYILTGALDSTVSLWDTATGHCVKKWFGHLEGIWGLAGDTLRVVTGANDGLVKVWEPKAGKCERTFTGPRGAVMCVGLSDSRMASGGEDGVIRVYSFQDMAGLEEIGTPN